MKREALAFVRWVEVAGAGQGIPVPNVAERLRSTGRGAYLSSLRLGPRELFDLVGNHFDADALIIRLAGPIRRWQTGARQHHQYLPAPAAAAKGLRRGPGVGAAAGLPC